MAEVVQLWVYLSTTPLFGLTATLVVYLLAHALYTRWQQAPWANPVFWSVVTLAALLTLTGVPYPSYFSGAQFIHFLLGPAVVALAWPLWQRREELKQRWGRLLLASTAGALAASAVAVGLGWALDLPTPVLLSLAPKLVTAPVAMGIAEKTGGIPALAAVFSVMTGLIGALAGKYLFDLLRIPAAGEGWQVRGFALGASSHGIGAARAMQVNADAGAYAGLGLGLQAVLVALWMPLLLGWLR
jgi:predicted murein hydrolase (TIGR00659 family)